MNWDQHSYRPPMNPFSIPPQAPATAGPPEQAYIAGVSVPPAPQPTPAYQQPTQYAPQHAAPQPYSDPELRTLWWQDRMRQQYGQYGR